MRMEEQINRIYNLSKEIRGRFLDQAIPIEMLIDDIISWHFCPEDTRQSLFFSLVSPKLTFSTKIQILKTILQLRYPDLLKEYPKLIGEIKELKNLRNKFAHSMLDASEEFLEKGYDDRIRLIFYKKGKKKYLVVKVDDILERLKTCSRVLLALVNIQKGVRQRVQVKKE